MSEGPPDELLAALHQLGSGGVGAADDELLQALRGLGGGDASSGRDDAEDMLLAELACIGEARGSHDGVWWLIGCWLLETSLLGSDSQHAVSLSAKSTELGLDRKDVRQVSAAMACASYVMEKMHWHCIESVVANAAGDQVQLIAHVDYSTYDGVDLKLLSRSFMRWASLHFHCEFHFVANMHTKTMSVKRVSDDVSGMVNATLSLDDFCMMVRFRESARSCIRRLVRIEDVIYISEDAIQYKQHVLDIFWGRSPDKKEARSLLLKIAPGDWRVHGVYQRQRIGDETEEQVADLISDTLIPLLYSHAPFEYPRNRWTGVDKAMADHGIPCCIHNLQAECFSSFGQTWAKYGVEDGRVDEDCGDGLDGGGEVDLADGAEPAPDLREAPNADMAKKNRSHRDKAEAWFRSSPADRLLGIRHAADPMIHYMHSRLQQSSDKWKTMMSMKALQEHGDTSLSQVREWPLLASALGSLEDLAFRELESRHDDATLFDCLPPPQGLLSLSNVLFKLLSRQAALFSELHAVHMGYPFALFALLVDAPSAKESLRNSCRSSRDDFTNSFVDYFGIDNVDSEFALAELTMIAVLVQLNTVQLENGNAGIKHVVDVMSTHVVLPSLSRISGDRVMAKLRPKLRQWKTPPGMKKLRTVRRQSLKQKKRVAVAKAIVPSVQSLATMIHGAGSDAIALRGARSEEAHGIASSLKQLREDVNKKAQPIMLSTFPTITDESEGMQCEAFQKNECMSTWFFSAAKFAPKLVDTMAEHDRKLLKTLATEWDKLRYVIVHASQPLIPDVPVVKNEKWSCQRAGICLCDEVGDDRWAFKL
ncbi:unnamed protein product, partial [Prorocentrum cordatum]